MDHPEEKTRALFLDRDGIINIDHGYVYQIENFEFTEGIFPLLRLFIKQGYILYIVTNQSGINRGYYALQDFEKITSYMLSELKKQDIFIESVQYCPHAPEEKCSCRKPATGMVDTLLFQHDIDLEKSWLIGDKQSDIDLANNAHIKNTIAIGKPTVKNYIYYFDTILECKEYIEENQGKIL